MHAPAPLTLRRLPPGPWRALLTASLLFLLVCLAEADLAFSTGFDPGLTFKLCAYEGTALQTPCNTDNGFPGDDADLTIIFAATTGIAPSTVVAFTPAAAKVPGPETNAWCANALDDDGDTKSMTAARRSAKSPRPSVV